MLKSPLEGQVNNGLVDGRKRVLVESLSPQVDGGRYPAKRVVGDVVCVEADIFADGHDQLSAVLKVRAPGGAALSESALQPVRNDRWAGTFEVTELGIYEFTVEAWVDPFKSWCYDLKKRVAAKQDVSLELLSGAGLVEAAIPRAGASDAKVLRSALKILKPTKGRAQSTMKSRIEQALDEGLAAVMSRCPDRSLATEAEPWLQVIVDPVLARFGAWYELFPRSCAPEKGRHGTFRDCEAQLPRIASMGFDILYLPPIHPIGRAYRKGKNNQVTCEPDDPGSPWGIGAAEGGHKAIHPALGTLEDFLSLVASARTHNIEIALDIAFQCSPDHPYVEEHPDWFRHRADGTIQYAENPPKKYQDIYPLDFETEDWCALWLELKSVMEFWAEQGIRVFRVDNPHTKALPFWGWVIKELKAVYPDMIFLAEAFTRPKLMYGLAKLGFTQSYNYFPWRNAKQELTEYFEEITRPPVNEFFRANLWPNTPDILTQYLQFGGRPAFGVRLFLAGTLGASYGIYGPAFECCDNQPREPGSEEYLNSEKYEIRHWDLEAPDNLTGLINRVNRIRRENPALHRDDRLVFHPTDNDQLIAYSKSTEDWDNVVLVVVNLDPHHAHSGWLTLDLTQLGLNAESAYQAHDLLTGERFLWQGSRNYVALDPAFTPAHILRLRKRVRSERDFDYFL